MKKILTLLAVATAVTTGSSAAMTGKFYGGLGLGMKKVHAEMGGYTASLGGRASNSDIYDVTSDKFAGQVFLGYRLGVSEMFYAGLEIDANSPYTYKNEADPEVKRNNTEFNEPKIKTGLGFGASLLLGWNVNESSSLFIRLGGEYRKHQISPNLGSAFNGLTHQQRTAKRSYTDFSFVPGVGGTMKMNDTLELSLDYRVNIGNGKKFGTNSTTDFTTKHTDKSHTMMARISYCFKKLG
ncbi:MAG: outer membrane beta-barrel protein [Alphaproteobacteria bacterium]|nr:MAG: outer membrane beta-barrel protein [Alphaproteobacteria bacterium]